MSEASPVADLTFRIFLMEAINAVEPLPHKRNPSQHHHRNNFSAERSSIIEEDQPKYEGPASLTLTFVPPRFSVT